MMGLSRRHAQKAFGGQKILQTFVKRLQRGPAAALPAILRSVKVLCVQKIRVCETGEQHAHKKADAEGGIFSMQGEREGQGVQLGNVGQ